MVDVLQCGQTWRHTNADTEELDWRKEFVTSHRLGDFLKITQTASDVMLLDVSAVYLTYTVHIKTSDSSIRSETLWISVSAGLLHVLKWGPSSQWGYIGWAAQDYVAIF